MMLVRDEAWLVVLRTTVERGKDTSRLSWELHEIVPWQDDVSGLWKGWRKHSPGTIPVGFRWSPLGGYDAAVVPSKYERWWVRRMNRGSVKDALRPIHLDAVARILVAMQRGAAAEVGPVSVSPAAVAARLFGQNGGGK